MYSLLTILPPSFSIYIYQYSCLRLLKNDFFSNTSLQYKLHDSFSTCITNFKSIISLLYILNNIYLHQVRLLQFMRGRLEHNTDTMQVLQLHFGAQVRYQKEKKKVMLTLNELTTIFKIFLNLVVDIGKIFSILSKVVSARIGMQLAYSSGSCADLINNAYLLFTFCSSPILVNDRMVNQFILKLMTTFHRCVHHLRGICYSLQVYHTNRLRIPENYCKFNT